MAKNIYIGVSGKALKVKKAYIGVSDKARKIKKGYIGVGGIARQFFSSDQKLVYYGKADDLSVARENLAATSVGDYALFAGGNSTSSTSGMVATVDTYDSNLVKGTATNMSVTKSNLAATSVGDYALFAGGATYPKINNSSNCDVVDTYNSNLVRSTAPNLSQARYDLAATSVGNYALFAGGYGSGYSKTVDAYDTNLVKNSVDDLDNSKSQFAGTSVGDYAIFLGSGYTTADYYTSSLVKGTLTLAERGNDYLAATSVGDYALFGGGRTNSTNTMHATVIVYNSNLVRSTAPNLSEARDLLTATNIGDCALFAGGRMSDGSANLKPTSTVDIYNSNLVRTQTLNLSGARYNLAATSIGSYALFGGGYHNTLSPYRQKSVDVYQVI